HALLDEMARGAKVEKLVEDHLTRYKVVDIEPESRGAGEGSASAGPCRTSPWSAAGGTSTASGPRAGSTPTCSSRWPTRPTRGKRCGGSPAPCGAASPAYWTVDLKLRVVEVRAMQAARGPVLAAYAEGQAVPLVLDGWEYAPLPVADILA